MRAVRGQNTPKRRVFRERMPLWPDAGGTGTAPPTCALPGEKEAQRCCPEDRNDRGRGTRRDNVRCLSTHLALVGVGCSPLSPASSPVLLHRKE